MADVCRSWGPASVRTLKEDGFPSEEKKNCWNVSWVEPVFCRTILVSHPLPQRILEATLFTMPLVAPLVEMLPRVLSSERLGLRASSRAGACALKSVNGNSKNPSLGTGDVLG